MGFESADVLALRAGDKDFRAFARDRAGDFDKLAAYVARRWRLPWWADQEDVRQEVLLGAWRATVRFDPGRGTAPVRYLIYSAIDRAKKQSHKWRKARGNRNRDAAASTLEARFTEPMERRHGTRDERFEAHERARAAESLCEDEREVLVVRALARHGSIAVAAKALYADPATRLTFEFVSRRHAREVVALVAECLAGRAGRVAA